MMPLQTPPPPTLVLASASPARLSVLRAAGLDPEVIVSQVDETAVLEEADTKYGPLQVADQVLLLARAKAEAVQDQLPEATGGHLILGCDSMFDFAGVAHGKPRDVAQGKAWWQNMSGGSGVLHTGHWLIDAREESEGGTGAMLGLTCSTTVHFAQVSDSEIDAYLATGEPLAVAGACTIDGLGAAFIAGLEGDHNNVIGLSVQTLRQLLSQMGLSITQFWQSPQ